MGIGKIVGYLILISYFTVLPAALKASWAYFFDNFDRTCLLNVETTVYVGSVFAINVGIFVIYNSILYVIYHMKHPFFEQYKNTDKPWPW